MKIKFLILFSVLLLSASTLHAQTNYDSLNEARLSSRQYNKAFYVSPFQFVLSTFQIGYENMFKNHERGILLNAGVTIEGANSSDQRLGGIGELQYRIYIIRTYKKTEENIYFGPFAQFKYIKHTDSLSAWPDPAINTTYLSYAGGVVFGIKFVVKKRLVLDLFTGGGARYSDIRGTQPRWAPGFFDDGHTGIFPRMGANIGITF
jgi:hypothetical protein